MIWICPQCDSEDISKTESGSYLVCVECQYAFSAEIHDQVTARLAYLYNQRFYKVKARGRVGRPRKESA